LVGWFTVGVRSSGYRAVSSTFHHWLCRKCEGEANIEEDEEDKGKQFFAKLMVIFLVGELVSVLHEGIGDCRQESGGSGGGPKIVQGRVTLIMKNWSSQTDSHQQELQGRVHLADCSGLDGGGWQGWVEIFRPGEGRNHRHIADVQPSVHKEQVPRDNKASERCRYLASVGESKEDNTDQDFVGQRIQEAANARGLTWKPPGYGTICQICCPSIDEKSSGCGPVGAGNAVGDVGRCGNSRQTEEVGDCDYSVFLFYWS